MPDIPSETTQAATLTSQPVEVTMAMTILKNGRTRLAFQFGRASALRSANDVIDQLQAQLDAERKQHAFDVAESEKQIAILLRDLMQAKYEIAQRNLVETFSKNGESINKTALAQHAADQTRHRGRNRRHRDSMSRRRSSISIQNWKQE